MDFYFLSKLNPLKVFASILSKVKKMENIIILF